MDSLNKYPKFVSKKYKARNIYDLDALISRNTNTNNVNTNNTQNSFNTK